MQPTWDEADLEARLCRALDVAKRTVLLFGEVGYADAKSPTNSFWPEKPIAETAMLIYAASGAGHRSNIAARVDELARLIAPHARSERTLLNAALHPAVCLDFALPHILLSKLGYCDEAADEFFRHCAGSLVRHGRERPPFGAVEQKWIGSLWTTGDVDRGWRSDLLNSVLHRPMDILGGLREDGYAFTHLLMYCTDFGFRSGRLPRGRSVVLGEASASLAKCLDNEDYDLAGELVMAWPLIGASWSAAATFGFRVLARVEDRIGVLPGGTTRIDRLKELQGRERTKYAFGTAYHTAYVMGLLCAVSLRPGRAPPKRLTGPLIERRFLESVLCLLDREQGHWQAELPTLTDVELNAIAPLLLDIAIVQKCRKQEYHAVKELIVGAYQHGLAYSPLCAQAAELLERLAAYASVSRSDRVPSSTAPSSQRADALKAS